MSDARAPWSLPRATGPLVGTAIAACVVALVVGGGAAVAVAGVEDAGALVRWGLPLTRAVQDLAAAVTIGLLFLATVAVPDRAAEAFARATRVAVVTGVVWVAAGLAGVVLGFADVAGTPVGSPGFTAQLQTFVWSILPLREGLISAALAATAVTVTALARSRTAVGWTGGPAVAALLPLALAGHAAGRASHETAVNAIAVHLVAVALWVGGLAALAILRVPLGSSLPTVVQRYSTVAFWCFVAVGVSGVVSASVRLGSPAELWTAYGALILAKVVAFGVLGVLGLRQRRRVIARLGAEPQSRALFARLVAVELVVMGAAVGIASALARTGNPNLDQPGASSMAEVLTGFPAPPAPTGADWITMWRWDWLWGPVAVVAILLYVGAVVRLHRRGDRWPVGRTVMWVAGWLVFAWATSGAPGVYGRVSFSWHMIGHMVIAMAVPILLVLAAPLTLVLRVQPHRTDGTYGVREILLGLVHSRYVRVVANPVVAAVIFFASMVVFYYTPLFELALTTHTGHVLMVVHFLLSGYLFAMVLVGVDPGPRKWAPALCLVILFATISFHAFFGVAVAQGTTLLAADFFHAVRMPWVPDPLADQQRGGAIAWGVGELPTLALALLVTLAWVRSDAAEARRHDRQAARDGDADLAAYNAHLARLAEQDAKVAARGTSMKEPR
ncbi:MAG: cytochrome c oxidase assembly protein [Dermatophilaceae bacterium]